MNDLNDPEFRRVEARRLLRLNDLEGLQKIADLDPELGLELVRSLVTCGHEAQVASANDPDWHLLKPLLVPFHVGDLDRMRRFIRREMEDTLMWVEGYDNVLAYAHEALDLMHTHDIPPEHEMLRLKVHCDSLSCRLLTPQDVDPRHTRAASMLLSAAGRLCSSFVWGRDAFEHTQLALWESMFAQTYLGGDEEIRRNLWQRRFVMHMTGDSNDERLERPRLQTEGGQTSSSSE